ncbi:alpha/beta hydrolase [Candidatus Methylomirabilis sp.]|uniref:alpha/beta fold hydrolase n=1 Tax=Candidatus Methylomirabilis sp. TaxID=2032687 RepID=UPI002A67ECBA|nr:alpha/beta hydrolase [Candidatus Methylomirabilis sp.]
MTNVLIRPTSFDWNPALELRLAGIDGGMIFYAVTGEGPPVLLLHGFGGEIWMWERQVAALSKRYRLYIPDLLGYGYSDRPKIDYTPSFFIEMIKQFMDQLGVSGASLIGNSMGAGIAWAFALAHPERVDKLVLIDGIPPQVVPAVRNRLLRWFLAMRHIPLLTYLVVALRTRRMVRVALTQAVYHDRLITDAVVERQYRIGHIAGTARAIASTVRYADEVARYAGALETLRKPTLIIWGEQDELFPVAVGEQLHASIRDSELVVIEGSGHMPMWEKPDETNQAILEFLGRE